jgi:hypothetical protein
MTWDPDLQNNNQTYNNPYKDEGYEKTKSRKLLLIVFGIFLAIALLLLTFHLSRPESQQSKYIKSTTAAARKQIPYAVVKNVKVAGGFAIATVSDPSSQGQSNSGNETIFKVNKDGSMVQIASGSYFSPIDLLGFGIPLATQAKLTGLEQKLSDTINNQNTNVKSNMAVICVNATRNNSNKVIDTVTYISTFTLQVQFITANGTLTKHTVTFAIGPHYYRMYTIDGRAI